MKKTNQIYKIFNLGLKEHIFHVKSFKEETLYMAQEVLVQVCGSCPCRRKRVLDASPDIQSQIR